MKSKVLAKVMGNELAGRIAKTVSTFYLQNQSTILTTGTIGFSWAATLLAVKNASEIHYVLTDYRDGIQNCNTKEERNKLISLTLKALMRRVLPILIFEGMATACAIGAKKHTDKVELSLAETAGALSIAQSAITQYQTFAKEAEDALGPERYHDIQKEISDNTVYEVSRCPVNNKQSDDDQLIYEPITGQLIWSTPDRVNLAWEKYKSEVKDSENHFVPVGQVFFERIGADYRTASSEVFGYYNEDAAKMSDSLYFDGIRVIVNGKEMSALKINYYPTIRLVTDEVFD